MIQWLGDTLTLKAFLETDPEFRSSSNKSVDKHLSCVFIRSLNPYLTFKCQTGVTETNSRTIRFRDFSPRKVDTNLLTLGRQNLSLRIERGVEKVEPVTGSFFLLEK